jgi:hypothetical protein
MLSRHSDLDHAKMKVASRHSLLQTHAFCPLVVLCPHLDFRLSYGGELRQPVTRVAKRYKFRAARSNGCEEVLRW